MYGLYGIYTHTLLHYIHYIHLKAPSFGDRRKAYLQDMAIATGATYVADEVGISLESVTLDMLGKADRVVVGKDTTTIITDSSNTEALAKRIAQIRAEADANDNKFDNVPFF